MEEFHAAFGKHSKSGLSDMLAVSAYVGAREKGEANPYLEGLIALNGEASYLYALKVLHGPFELGEPAISRSPDWSLKYARFVIKGRFRMGESRMTRNSEVCYQYFKYVVRRKLPKRMHLAMLKYRDSFTTKYLEEVSD